MMSTEETDLVKKHNSTVDEDGLTRARTRVSRACTRCRSRKDKCDGQRPSCSTCAAAGQLCSYEPATKKRGLPEGYVRGLEKLWAILIHKINGLENAVVQILADEQHSLLQIWNHHHNGEELHTMWKDSRVLQELENLLAGLDHSTTKRKREHDGNDEEDSPDSVAELNACLHTQYQVQPSSNCVTPDSKPQPESKTGSNDWKSAKVTLPPNSSKLLNHYFTYTHNWLPILDRPLMLKRCYEFSKTEVLLEDRNPDLAVLCAVLAYTSYQTKNVESSLRTSATMSPESLSTIARKCLPSMQDAFAIGHIQAILILVLLDIGMGRWKSAWLTIGLASRALPEMHTANGTSARAVTAAYQGCFIMDTLVSLCLKRRPQFRRADIDSRSLLQEDGHEEWEPWNGPGSISMEQREPAFSISCFNRLTELFMILNDCISTSNVDSDTAYSPYFETKVAELHTLASKYTFAIADTSTRPPHQIWLQLSHLLALSYISWRAGHNHNTIEKCVNVVNQLLELCIGTTSLDLQNLPTFLLGNFQFFASTLEHGQLSSNSGLPNLGAKLADCLSHCSSVWPENDKLVRTLRGKQNPNPNPSQASAQVAGDLLTKRRKIQPQEHVPSTSARNQLHLWPSDPFAYQLGSAGDGSTTSMPFARNQSGAVDFRNQYGFAESSARFSAASETSTPQIGQHGSASIGGQDPMSLDALAAEQGIPGGISMPSVETSPSFQGDEIDALFHEMAQLDTTEWTSGRNQGLKDFGFSDDLTFEAFCNDPDRLTASNVFDQQSFNNDDSNSAFGYVPPSIPQSNQRTISNSFDLLSASWNG